MGMRQRLTIAQAIMEDQDIILLDEPMNNLDQEGVKDIRNLLLYLKEQGKVFCYQTIILRIFNICVIKSIASAMGS